MRKLSSFLFILAFSFSCAENEPKAIQETSKTESPLPSWSESTSRENILSFITKTTSEGSPDFIPEADRIAVFDNDGTLWSEQPYYFELDYALYYIKKEASNHPEWANNPNLKAVIANDLNAIIASGEKGLMEIVMTSHAGMTEDEFSSQVKDWLTNAKHPKTGKAYNQMIYQPMIELLDFLRANGYKTFIVSGGGIDFLRVWAEEAYGIPPYQVVGSSIKAKYEEVDGKKVVVKIPEINLIDDKAGKPVGIHQYIGKKPVIAVGNSDGDFEMLEYTTGFDGPRLGMLIHHTDSLREFAYDSVSHIGQLKRGLIEGPKYGWLIVDMAEDWKTIYP